VDPRGKEKAGDKKKENIGHFPVDGRWISAVKEHKTAGRKDWGKRSTSETPRKQKGGTNSKSVNRSGEEKSGPKREKKRFLVTRDLSGGDKKNGLGNRQAFKITRSWWFVQTNREKGLEVRGGRKKRCGWSWIGGRVGRGPKKRGTRRKERRIISLFLG